jgi:hypothetical protein
LFLLKADKIRKAELAMYTKLPNKKAAGDLIPGGFFYSGTDISLSLLLKELLPP